MIHIIKQSCHYFILCLSNWSVSVSWCVGLLHFLKQSRWLEKEDQLLLKRVKLQKQDSTCCPQPKLSPHHLSTVGHLRCLELLWEPDVSCFDCSFPSCLSGLWWFLVHAVFFIAIACLFYLITQKLPQKKRTNITKDLAKAAQPQENWKTTQKNVASQPIILAPPIPSAFAATQGQPGSLGQWKAAAELFGLGRAVGSRGPFRLRNLK